MEDTNKGNTAVKAELTKEELFENIETALKDLKLSRAWAAKMIGVSAEYLRRVFRGVEELSSALRQKLLEFLQKIEQMTVFFKAA